MEDDPRLGDSVDIWTFYVSHPITAKVSPEIIHCDKEDVRHLWSGQGALNRMTAQGETEDSGNEYEFGGFGFHKGFR
jgi:hypothetical protein